MPQTALTYIRPNPGEDLVALHVDDGTESYWIGYSGWFKRRIRRRVYSHYDQPQLITREDALMIKEALAFYGPRYKVEIWELTRCQDL